jgi:hypothetical protein
MGHSLAAREGMHTTGHGTDKENPLNERNIA